MVCWVRFDPTLTWDGLLTFIGGILAFFAILIQVHYANMGMRTQLKAEGDARAEEREAQKRALARALLAEIRAFDDYHIRPTLKALEEWDSRTGDPRAVTIVDPPAVPFPVYRMNAQRVGEYGDGQARSITDFYVLAEGFVVRMREASKRGASVELAGSKMEAVAVARRTLAQIKEILPSLVSAADQVKTALEHIVELTVID